MADIIMRKPLFLCMWKMDSLPLFLIMGLKICQNRELSSPKVHNVTVKFGIIWKLHLHVWNMSVPLLLQQEALHPSEPGPGQAFLLFLLVRRTGSGLLHQSLSKNWYRYTNIIVLETKSPLALSAPVRDSRGSRIKLRDRGKNPGSTDKYCVSMCN